MKGILYEDDITTPLYAILAVYIFYNTCFTMINTTIKGGDWYFSWQIGSWDFWQDTFKWETVDEENGWIQTLKIQFPTGTCPVVQGRNIYSRSCAAQENMIFWVEFFFFNFINFNSRKTWASFSSLFLVKVKSIIFALGMPGFPYIILYTNDIFFFTKHNNLVWGSWQMQFKYFPTESQEQKMFIFSWPVSKFFVYLKKKRDIFPRERSHNKTAASHGATVVTHLLYIPSRKHVGRKALL